MENSNVTTLKQVFLYPGDYRVGGQILSFTRKELSDLAANTKRLLASGIRVPLWPVHTPPGDPSGGPQDSSTGERNALTNKGWMVDVQQLSDGSLQQTLEVLDDETTRAIKSKRVRFTSPEIGEYIDGIGRSFKTVIRHMALTATPRNPKQGEFVPVVQFSRINRINYPVQFSLDDYVRKGNKTVNANPNLPKSFGQPSPQQINHVVGQLKRMGVMLPQNWRPDANGFAVLGSSLATKLASETTADDQLEESGWVDGRQAEQNPQFSENARQEIERLEQKIGDIDAKEQLRACGFRY